MAVLLTMSSLVEGQGVLWSLYKSTNPITEGSAIMTQSRYTLVPSLLYLGDGSQRNKASLGDQITSLQS